MHNITTYLAAQKYKMPEAEIREKLSNVWSNGVALVSASKVEQFLSNKKKEEYQKQLAKRQLKNRLITCSLIPILIFICSGIYYFHIYF